MTAAHTPSTRPGGIRLRTPSADAMAAATQNFLTQLAQLGLQHEVETANGPPSLHGGVETSFHLRADLAEQWAPGLDTAGLAGLPQPVGHDASDTEREIVLAMLLSPVGFAFAGHAELASAVRIRRNLVVAARQTALAFHTTEVDRPACCWRYDADRGFTVRPGHGLIASLQKATQPDASGRRYSFSCYRATEYVVLLAIAQELEHCNPALLAELQQQWERQAIA